MPKPKKFLKQGKNNKRKDEPALNTADDYQAAGVDFEEAAGKHRAGDPLKSLRFFERAINIYDEGLRKFSNSFDLAYNRARVQYEVATHPKLAKQQQRPLLDVLGAALISHEYALKLDENDADLLFNTSQVLTSIAEELANDSSSEEAIRLLQSALDLQARCFSVQELKYAENLRQQQEAREIFESTPTVQSEEVPLPDTQTDELSASDEGQWVSIVEPVTEETLADTVVACLGTITTLCTTITSSNSQLGMKALRHLANQKTELIENTLSLSFPDLSTVHEIYLANTIFESAFLDAKFTFSEINASTYAQSLSGLWSVEKPRLNIQSSTSALIAHANALIAFNYSLSVWSITSEPSLRWSALSTAIASLTSASKLPSIIPGHKAQTHLLRGDASLLQFRMSLPPTVFKAAAGNAAILLQNAIVFYRNAAQLGTEQESREKALFRADITRILGTNGLVMRSDLQGGGEVEEELQEMLNDGMLIERIDERGESVYG